jgi:uncharacterized pyridoxamine 5'-phosphate oxidase family protein
MKEYPERMSLDELRQHFEGFPLAHVATIEGNQPRVRAMSLISWDNKLWLATKTEWDKVEQIRRNNRVEFTVMLKTQERTGSLRITAEAALVDDTATKTKLASAIPWFHQYWKDASDSNFTLIRLDLTRILFDHPSDRKKYTVALT